MGWLEALLGIGNFFSSINQRNKANAQAASASAEQTQLDQQLLNLFQGPLGGSVQSFLTRMMQHPLSIILPQLAQQENVLGNEIKQGVNTFKNSLGSATPNVAGSIQDLFEKGFEAKANLGSGAIGEMTNVETAGAQGLTQFINSFANALGGVASQYGAAGSQIAANEASAPNPFASTFSMLANPNIDWSQISKLFQRAGNPGTDSALYTTQSGVPYAP